MAGDRGGDVFPLRQRDAVQRGHQADLVGFDDGSRRDLHLEQIQVDAVGTGQQHVDLRPFLAAVLQERLAVFVIGMSRHALGQESSHGDRARRPGR